MDSRDHLDAREIAKGEKELTEAHEQDRRGVPFVNLMGLRAVAQHLHEIEDKLGGMRCRLDPAPGTIDNGTAGYLEAKAAAAHEALFDFVNCLNAYADYPDAPGVLDRWRS